MNVNALPPWESLMKRMVWQQLGEISGQRILDFGSGTGETACFFARKNDVLAVEPSQDAVLRRRQEHPYRQLLGSTDRLMELPDQSFDVILCHNVLEYAPDREEIVRQFARLMKREGLLSLVKHNRPGRVMQMAVLLNDFDRANALLDGSDGSSAQYGTISYYEDQDVERWCAALTIEKTLGLRTFWHLQQKQDCHRDCEWQEKMLALETRVSDLEAYKAIAFGHHLLIRKKEYLFEQ